MTLRNILYNCLFFVLLCYQIQIRSQYLPTTVPFLGNFEKNMIIEFSQQQQRGAWSCFLFALFIYINFSSDRWNKSVLCLTGLNKTNDISVHSFKCSYMEESGHSAPNNGRSSHNVGRLGNLIRVALEFLTLLLWFFFLYIYWVSQY